MKDGTIKALILGDAYGMGAFAIGFLFGALRETVLIPALGAEGGQLAEFPLVTAFVCLLGYWMGKRFAGSVPVAAILGIVGVAVLLVFDMILAFRFMDMSQAEFFGRLDLSKGELFPVGLILMGLAPAAGAWIARR